MKITETLTHRNSYNSFFWTSGMIHGICTNFVGAFIPIDNQYQTIKLTLSINNPKKKGYRKITRSNDRHVIMNDREFEVCRSEVKLLNSIGAIDTFWIKIELQ
jgi:hypothetical protein